MKVGDVVVCINTKGSENLPEREGLKLGARYTIRKIITEGFCCMSDRKIEEKHMPIGFLLEEVCNGTCHKGVEPAYDSSRFEKPPMKLQIIF